MKRSLLAVLVVIALAACSSGAASSESALPAAAATATSTAAPTPTQSPTPRKTQPPRPTQAPSPTPEPEPEVTLACARQFWPLMTEVESLHAWLQEGGNLDSYSARVERVGAVYDEVFAAIDTDGMTAEELLASLDCLGALGVKLESVVNEYIKARSAWAADANDDDTIQGHWSTASGLIADIWASLPEEAAALPTPAPQVVKLSGSGDRNSKKFTLVGGDYSVVFSGRATDGGNIAIVLYAGDGEYIDLVVNELRWETGNWKYTNDLYNLEPGEYYFEVSSPGKWSIVLKEQR